MAAGRRFIVSRIPRLPSKQFDLLVDIDVSDYPKDTVDGPLGSLFVSAHENATQRHLPFHSQNGKSPYENGQSRSWRIAGSKR